MIPPTNENENAALFSFPLNWDVFDKSDLLEKKVRPFLLRKSKEFFNQEQVSFVDIIVEKIVVHMSPEKLIRRLQKVLDAETEKFVAALWRMIIFETLKFERFHLIV